MTDDDRAQAPGLAEPEKNPREDPVSTYKRLLQQFIDRRPSGTRLKIASALGTNKSFVTQITSPSYAVPVPEVHVPTIMSVCHFSQDERDMFLAAYSAAHPGRVAAIQRTRGRGEGYRRLQILVPQFDDPSVQRDVEDTIRTLAERIIRLAKGV